MRGKGWYIILILHDMVELLENLLAEVLDLQGVVRDIRLDAEKQGVI